MNRITYFILVMGTLAGLGHTARAAVTPVSWWRMGENDGTISAGAASSTTDLFGGRTMTLVGFPFYDPGVSSTAATRVGSTWCMWFFSGTYGTNALIPTLTNNFGIELWVNPNDTTGTKCLAYNGNSGASGWGLFLVGNQYQGLFGAVSFVGTATATAGTWTHLALVRDNGTATLYVNGVASGTTPNTPNPPSGIFAVAARPQDLTLEHFAGYIDEIRAFTFTAGTFSTNDLLLVPHAKNCYWAKPTGGTYNTGTNWLYALPPDLADDAYFTNATSYQISWNASDSIASVIFNATSGSATQAIGSYTWQMTNSCIVGRDAGSAPTVTLASGTLRATNAAGTGFYEVRRGLGRLNGGVMDVDWFRATNTAGAFEFNGGTLLFDRGLVSNSLPFTVGANAAATPAVLAANSPGAFFDLTGLFILGSNAPNSQLYLTNGGDLGIIGSGQVGLNSASSSNLAVVAAGSYWNMNGTFYLGYAGQRNQLLISNGGSLACGTAYIGFAPTSRSNLVSISGLGSIFATIADLDFGFQGSGNQFLVSNSALVHVYGGSVVGFDYVATNNQVLVSSGANFIIDGDLTAGNAGTNNSIIVQSGGNLSVGNNAVVGWASGGGSNYLAVSGASLQTGGTLESRRGRIQFDGGSITATTLLLTSAGGYFGFNAGALTVANTTVNNSRPFTVGDGAGVATFILASNGVHTFANGLVVQSNATLQGSGTIGGTLTLNAGATLSPGSFGKIVCSNSPTLLGIVALGIGTNSVGVTNDQVQLLSGTLTYGGSLVVTKMNGTLAAGNKFKLFNAPAYASAFSSLNLPPLGAGLGWNNTLAVDGSIQVVTATAPNAVTTPATAIIPTGATLNGTVDPGFLTTATWFEWGATTNYGNFTSTNSLLAPNGPSAVGNALTGLTPGSTYNYRLGASNALGSSYGTNVSFSLPIFTNVPIPGLAGVSAGSLAWGDYDNDGRLDLLIIGTTNGTNAISQLWRNTGNSFTNVPIPGLAGLCIGSIAWGDYDNDGRLDFLITGSTNVSSTNGLAQLWRNTGGGFTNVPIPGLPGLYDSSVAWGDYDNDGRLDFVILGRTNGLAASNLSQLWRNTGSGFSNVTVSVAPGLPAVSDGSVAWGDYDNDGILDILIAGYHFGTNGFGPTSQLWRNTGTGFSNVTAGVFAHTPPSLSGLQSVYDGSAAWGDFDNDGRLDLLIGGNPGTGFDALQLWNGTTNQFIPYAIPNLKAIHSGTTVWGDFDNDGLLDVLVTGQHASGIIGDAGPISELWRNTGSGFSSVSLPGVPALRNSFVAWGDFDNDGRLDFLIIGSDGTNSFSQLWRNASPATNSPPPAPTGLALSATPGGALLSWNASAGMSYNVRAGSIPGGTDLLAGQVNVTNGFRRLPAIGNAMLRGSLPLLGVTNDQTVYWSVQAVNNSFTGGPFATETSFVSSIVTTTADSGAGSLRQAAANPAPSQIIRFDPSLSGQTINLTSGQITLSNAITLDASSLPAGITVSGNKSSRVFQTTAGSTVVLNSLGIANGGSSASGGGILNSGNLTLNSCTLSGNIAGIGASQSASGNGGAIASSGGPLTLNQCTLSGNSANAGNSGGGGGPSPGGGDPGGGSALGNGGGISCSGGATVSVNQCTLSGNSAGSSGGGIYNSGGSLTVNNSIVAGNTQGSGGNINGTYTGQNNLTSGDPLLAALGNYGGPTQTMPPLPGSPAIDGCTNGTSFAIDQRGLPRLVGAYADVGAVESGTVIPGFDYSVVTITNDVLNDGVGGVSLRTAVANVPAGSNITFASILSGQTITLTSGQITLSNSTTIDASSLPGGVAVSGNNNSRVFEIATNSSATLNSLTIRDGYTNGFGGGILNYGNLALVQCGVSSNSSGSGGGLFNKGGTVTLEKCTLAGNAAGVGSGGTGGGISSPNGGTVVLNQCTVTANSVQGGLGNGGGIIFGGGTTVVVNQCTFCANTAGNGGGIYNFAGTLTVSNSIVAGNTGGDINGAFTGQNNLTGGSPLLAALGNYGGRTQTMPPLPGSPAIDAGTDSVTNSLAADQRGLPRLVGAHVDIGAVESGTAIPGFDYTVVTTTNDFLSEFTNNGVSLRSAVAYTATNATIIFSPTLSGQTIVLTNGQIVLSKHVTIDGSALASPILISGNAHSRIFYVHSGVAVTNNSLVIINGDAGGDGGGGIYSNGSLTLFQCTLANNRANGGGGIFINTGALNLNNSTLVSNNGGGGYFGGGGLCIGDQGVIAVNNSTFAYNSSTNGGGIYNDSGILTLNHCTLANNTSSSGGGIYNFLPIRVDITNSIISLNTGGDYYGTPNSFVTSLTNRPDIRLAPLANYGGPTQTMPPLPGSPAIDAGTDSVTNSLATDQRGLPRLVGAHVDIGAVEGVFNPNYPHVNMAKLGDGSLQLGFTNLSGLSYTVYASTNVAAPLNTWSNLGAPIEAPAGTFYFTDTQATNYPFRFYRVTTP